MRFSMGGLCLINLHFPFPHLFRPQDWLFNEVKDAYYMIRRYESVNRSPLRGVSIANNEFICLDNLESEGEVTYPDSSTHSSLNDAISPCKGRGRQGHSFEKVNAINTRRVGDWLSKLPDTQPKPVPSMPRYSEKCASFSSSPNTSPSKSSTMMPSSFSLNMTIRKLFTLVGFFLALVLFFSVRLIPQRSSSHTPAYLLQNYHYNATFVPQAPFQPPEPVPYRASDVVDTFASYKYRNTCNISSLDLHAPFAPLCQDRQSLLTAMSSGGRIGNDAPYMPRGCDMRWFSTEEICEVLRRFSRVVIVGDSMMRHLAGSINVLLRKDLGYGAVTDWNFSVQERQDCFCNYQFNVKSCSVQGIYKTSDVAKHDPDSLACKADAVDVEGKHHPLSTNRLTNNHAVEAIVKFPIPEHELTQFRKSFGPTKPEKPIAFVFGHGLWNDLDLQATLDWLDAVLDTATSAAPYLREPNAFFPRLFLTPNACGKEKEDQFLVTQGDKALMLFEENVGIEVNRRGVEHLGTWNMSAQSNKYDGVHLDLRGNMIKAMMVINWLSMLEVEKYD